jgi:hypothetical protein
LSLFEIRFLAERAGPPCSRCGLQTAFQSSVTGGARAVKRCVFASLGGAPLCASCLTPWERERLAAYLSGVVDGITSPPPDAERRALTLAQFRDALESPLAVRGFTSRATSERRARRRRETAAKVVAVASGAVSTADVNQSSGAGR